MSTYNHDHVVQQLVTIIRANAELDYCFTDLRALMREDHPDIDDLKLLNALDDAKRLLFAGAMLDSAAASWSA
ncbi:hypothetical protein [Bradyrhizobium japonicum]|uniref:hypothetical protein n=1 Tax=Bradyrhizobium japonicum TaxID=375 RepID=UPI001E49863D|nr:hypothetical protein [Bradyrhizobium japonicum]MCD9821177.1 hypothetical protein [Bradyrhizobium japonicum]MEB2674126.1 hypothetical protein [Bradyrhizobium japonicum]WRI93313.1 hypothetical protein R3F75_21210 [Bradyrhizobium japonicum]